MKYRPLFAGELLTSLAGLLLLLGAVTAFDCGCHRSSEYDQIPDSEIAESVDPPSAEAGYGVNTRSSRWPTVRNHYIFAHPACEACGATTEMNVHHVEQFSEHPEKELDPANLISLCRKCHFLIGHDPDGPGPMPPTWKKSNPNVRADAASHLKQIQSKTTLAP